MNQASAFFQYSEASPRSQGAASSGSGYVHTASSTVRSPTTSDQ